MSKHIAVVGPRGSGKTFLSTLLARKYAEDGYVVGIEFEGPTRNAEYLKRILLENAAGIYVREVDNLNPRGGPRVLPDVFIYDGRIPVGVTQVITTASVMCPAPKDLPSNDFR